MKRNLSLRLLGVFLAGVLGVRAQHHHVAPHGGTPVELGEEVYHVELVREADTDILSAYVLDGEMENFIRITAPSISLQIARNGTKETLVLAAVPNSATGEMVGDTSLFEATADWLKTTKEFDAVFPKLDIRGTTFTNVAFHFPTGNDEGGHVDAAPAEGKKKEHRPHVSPRGGTLVEIGAHQFNVDLVLDRATGTLHSWILGAHAKGTGDIVRTAMPSFEAKITVDGTARTLVFHAVPNPAAGEKPGDASAFDAQADWLKTAATFDGVFPKLVIRDTTFADTTFNFPKGRPRK